MAIQAVKGTRDILPEEVGRWQHVEGTARAVFQRYSFREIRTPLFESTELFARGIGEATDIVTKEMYTLTDRGGRSLTLRPENTAPVVRAAIEHHLFQRVDCDRLYYIGPMFRYERPQKGRMRQFSQIGVEAFGSEAPALDAEIIEMSMVFLGELGIRDTVLKVNSVGCEKCRPVYRERLREALSDKVDQLCSDCQRRYRENPLRILDCKVGCRRFLESAPTLLDTLDEACREHFRQVKHCLERLEVPHRVDPLLVRGLDYYMRTTFEVEGGSLGAQNALLGGGRYDGLVEELGGSAVPAFGFACGLDRLVLSLPEEASSEPKGPNVFVAAIGSAAWERALLLVRDLRRKQLWVEWEPDPGKTLKAQSRRADRLGARYLLFLGDQELGRGVWTLKDMRQGTQREIPASDLEGLVKELVR
ncbi:MAG TPA: histidine--tRNA ligase [Candidatus Polarisedimenticolia bacterium]|nr:histidine--tRNA ligase [Candidatus Polarisedimenticolia bacterium]